MTVFCRRIGVVRLLRGRFNSPVIVKLYNEIGIYSAVTVPSGAISIVIPSFT